MHREMVFQVQMLRAGKRKAWQVRQEVGGAGYVTRTIGLKTEVGACLIIWDGDGGRLRLWGRAWKVHCRVLDCQASDGRLNWRR